MAIKDAGHPAEGMREFGGIDEIQQPREWSPSGWRAGLPYRRR